MNLNQEDWRKQLEADNNAVVLDVRTKDETLVGVIPIAVNIDIYKGQEFITDVDRLDKSKNYYVYCRAGSRSEQACKIMNDLGFDNTYNLIGGMSQWNGDVALLEE